MDPKLRILFLCTHNSCRSPMAEAFAWAAGKGDVDVMSAGDDPRPVNPLAVRAMADVGIDLAEHRGRRLGELLDERFDLVITVCDRIKETCPTWPGAREHIHWSMDDPAEATGSEAERLKVFRRVRDAILHRVRLCLLAHRIGTRA